MHKIAHIMHEWIAAPTGGTEAAAPATWGAKAGDARPCVGAACAMARGLIRFGGTDPGGWPYAGAGSGGQSTGSLSLTTRGERGCGSGALAVGLVGSERSSIF